MYHKVMSLSLIKKRQSEVVYRDLSLGLRGSISSGKKESSFCRDYGGETTKCPRFIAHVTCEEDIAHVLKVANQHKMPVAIRGVGHSCNQHTLTEGILLVNCAEEQTEQIKISSAGLVTTPTRMTWRELEKELNRHDLSCPVLTNLLPTTIGGTLSVGGCGIRSHRYGFQVDQVIRLKLILPSGDSIWCSEDENADLFRYSLAGLGSVGVLETAVLRTIPYKPFSLITEQILPISRPSLNKSVEIFMSFIEKENPDWAYMSSLPTDLRWTPQASFAYGYENPLPRKDLHGIEKRDYHFKMTETVQALADNIASNTNFFFDFILPYDVVQKFIDFLEPRFSEPVFYYLLGIYILSLKRPAYAPYIPLHPVPEKKLPYVGLSLFFSVSSSCPEYRGIKEKIEQLRDLLLHQCIALGGRPYLSGSYQLNRNMASAIFGESFDTLQALRRRYDPSKILPGFIDHDA